MADLRASLRRYVRTPKGQFTLIMALLTVLAASQSGWRLVGPGLLGAVCGAMLVDAPLLRWREKRWTFPDGAMLTGWIVAFVLSPHEPWYVASITAIVGVLSKYLWRSGRANVFNPAAFALVATFYIFHAGQSWWGALPELSLGWILVLLGTGLFMVQRLNKVPLLLSFLGVFFSAQRSRRTRAIHRRWRNSIAHRICTRRSTLHSSWSPIRQRHRQSTVSS